MTAAERDLYTLLGGEKGVSALVHRFYDLVLKDPELAPFFAGVPMDRLRHMQTELFTAALGGPDAYTGRHIAHAHQHLPISRAHLQRFVDHLFTSLGDVPISEQDRYDIIARINLYTDDVLGVGSDFSD